MIETITISKDKSHLLIISKDNITEQSIITEATEDKETTETNQELNYKGVAPLKSTFSLQAIPLESHQKIILDLDYTNRAIKNCRVVKDIEEQGTYEIEPLQQQALHQIENISFKFTEIDTKFIVIVDIESGYQDVSNARYPLNKSISNIFDETSSTESIAISIDDTDEREPQLMIDLIKAKVLIEVGHLV